MTKNEVLAGHYKVAQIHVRRLSSALEYVKKLMPVTGDSLDAMSSMDIGQIDMMCARFSKLQDLVGSKIFPLILDILGENAQTHIDKLNKLEKLYYLDDASWWMDLREVRNDITHDYPNDNEVTAKMIADLIVEAEKLLIYWNGLALKIVALLEPLNT